MVGSKRFNRACGVDQITSSLSLPHLPRIRADFIQLRARRRLLIPLGEPLLRAAEAIAAYGWPGSIYPFGEAFSALHPVQDLSSRSCRRGGNAFPRRNCLDDDSKAC